MRSPLDQFGSPLDQQSRYASPFGAYTSTPSVLDSGSTGVFERDVGISNTARISPLSPLSPLPPVERMGWWDDLVSQYSDSPELSIADIESDLSFL
jgi:hypothetical protein